MNFILILKALMNFNFLIPVLTGASALTIHRSLCVQLGHETEALKRPYKCDVGRKDSIPKEPRGCASLCSLFVFNNDRQKHNSTAPHCIRNHTANPFLNHNPVSRSSSLLIKA
ncbi:purple acid phosphatase 13 [Striga asiatica]|uniref:Purple acid phosphatase 13 n=1 Tax=Striga asiatica TaxID=4170 RepID=A0A5A7QYU6_STRAF|nr:purple acid phosphatase 13 [Striga asiatica]